MKRTKIVCTIGPASNNEEVIRELIKSGLNVSRHNFSHDIHENHEKNMNMIRKVAKELGKHVAVLLDTKGPEIRTGDFNDKVELKEGNKFTIYCNEVVLGDETKCSITYDELYKDVEIGDTILIDDGLVGLNVDSIEENKIHCTIKNSGFVSSKKGINVPGVKINLPAITEKDMEDLKFGCRVGVDIVAASFVRKAADVLEIRKVLADNGGEDILIFSKIENQEGVDNIDDIIKLSDGIMVARGDLGVEIPTADVPLAQKMMIEKCNKVGKPVITATQMLDSMIRNPRPTRAEASDVANAIFDGTDAIMLSGETANGKYPVEAVKTMADIAIKAESAVDYKNILRKKSKEPIENVPSAISLSTCTSAVALNAKAIITATQSGHSARMVSKYRPNCNIIAVTPYESVANKLAINWGVSPLVAPQTTSTDELIDESVNASLTAGYVEKGDLVVIAAGIPVNYVGSTNLMKIHVVGDVLATGKGLVKRHGHGTVTIVNSFEEATANLDEGEVLVCEKLDDRYLELLEKANAIIVQSSDVSSNVIMECIDKEIPLIVGAENAMKVLKNGCFVTIDGRRGIIYAGKSRLE